MNYIENFSTKMTRKEFLKAISLGAAGGVLAGFSVGCSAYRRFPWRRRGAVKIIAFGDMHIVDEDSTAYPSKVVEAMNREGGDLVLGCGDFGKDGLRSELELAKGVLDKLEISYYPVMGNHDALYSGEKEEVLFKEIFSLKQGSYTFVKRGIHFIGIDHGCGKDHMNNSVRPEVIAWIKMTLQEIPRQEPIILFSHYPFAEKARSRTKNAAEVKSLFKDRKLLAIIGGHFHGNTEYYEDGVLMTTTVCCSSTRNNHDGTKGKGFRVFHIDNNMNITIEFKEVPQV